MKSREIFRMAIKIIGLIILLQGIRNVVEGFMILKGYATVRLSTPQYWAAWAVIKMAAGVYLMKGVTPFLNLAFPLKLEAEGDATEAAPNRGGADAVRRKGCLMDPKVMFDLIVRTAGLVVILYGLQYLVDDLLYAMKTAQSQKASSQGWEVVSVVQILVGVAMVRGLVPLVDFAFPGDRTDAQPRAEAPPPQDETRDA